MNRRYQRKIRDTGKTEADYNLDKLGSALSTGAKSIAFSSCYMSVKTPNTFAGAKSKYGGSVGGANILNRTSDNFEIYS
jgi:hypothetical protein